MNAFTNNKKRGTTQAISNAGLVVLSRFWCFIPFAIFIFVRDNNKSKKGSLGQCLIDFLA